jgi:hypothetical protein
VVVAFVVLDEVSREVVIVDVIVDSLDLFVSVLLVVISFNVVSNVEVAFGGDTDFVVVGELIGLNRVVELLLLLLKRILADCDKDGGIVRLLVDVVGCCCFPLLEATTGPGCF